MKKENFFSGDLLDQMTAAFKQKNMEQAEAEAVAIIAELLDCSRNQVRFDRQMPLTQELYCQAQQIIERRLNDEPWQYIFQRAYFRDLVLQVNPAVLIPRPETELLVDWCINILPEHASVLDMGTGSGAIALSLATERPDLTVTASDISIQALQTAQRNAECLAPGRVEFIHSDLFAAMPEKQFDVIAANLPYVTENEYAQLSREVRDFEPALALVSGHDGLDLIRRIINEAYEHLTPRGAMILEMSDHQTETAAGLLAETCQWRAIEILKDYTQRRRFVTARKAPETC